MDNTESDDSLPLVASAGSPVGARVSEGGGSLAVGPTLRAARERMGVSLPECSRQLFIRLPFLEALEEGRHRDLPGGAYAAGFLRTYAEFLGLDGEELVRRFRQEGAGGFTNRTELMFPSPVSEGRIPGGAVIFLGLVLAAVTYGGWYLLSSSESDVAEMVPPLPERLSSMLGRQAALTGEPAAETAEAAKVREDVVPPSEGEDDKAESPKAEPPKVEPPKAEPPKVEPPKVEPPKVEPPKVEPPKAEPPKVEPPKVEPPKAEPPKVEPPKVEAAAPAAPEPAAAPAGKVYGAEYPDSRVTLRAVADDCWLQVREMDGSTLTSRLLRRGESLRLPNRPGLTLMVGNAGALEVVVDGRRMAPLGAVGQVRRDVKLDPDRLGAGG